MSHQPTFIMRVMLLHLTHYAKPAFYALHTQQHMTSIHSLHIKVLKGKLFHIVYLAKADKTHTRITQNSPQKQFSTTDIQQFSTQPKSIFGTLSKKFPVIIHSTLSFVPNIISKFFRSSYLQSHKVKNISILFLCQYSFNQPIKSLMRVMQSCHKYSFQILYRYQYEKKFAANISFVKNLRFILKLLKQTNQLLLYITIDKFIRPYCNAQQNTKKNFITKLIQKKFHRDKTTLLEML
eukprot:TRINITY_DN4159_c0_g1_i8.p1 TRINITY_DN4159_c0_g1~~TRINITY_DN4159_c0_g1_i8.p1  ORF type:complete len:277 (-),score=-25.75 TRINITY_DN4159_c0_g1_i8:599-1309(-)